MDPTANLEEQLRLAKRIQDGVADGWAPDRLAELVLAPNEWIIGGGFLPRQWQGKGPASAYAPLK